MSSKEHEDRLGQSETGWAETQGSERPGPQSTRASGAPWGGGTQGRGWGRGWPPRPGQRSTLVDRVSVREAGEEPGKLGKLPDRRRASSSEKLWAHGMDWQDSGRPGWRPVGGAGLALGWSPGAVSAADAVTTLASAVCLSLAWESPGDNI